MSQLLHVVCAPLIRFSDRCCPVDSRKYGHNLHPPVRFPSSTHQRQPTTFPLVRLTAILVSRFLLDLQYANTEVIDLRSGSRGSSHGGTDTTHTTSSINFDRVIGSIGSMDEPCGESNDSSSRESTGSRISHSIDPDGEEKRSMTTIGGQQSWGAVLPVAMDRRETTPPHHTKRRRGV